MSNRFIHAADLHLDSPFVGIGTLREGLDDVMRDASLDAWDALIDCCLDEDAAFLVLAGDLFDRADGTPRGRSRVRRGIERLHAAGIRVFAIHGNHDPLSGRSPLQGLEGVTVFRKDVPISETFEGPTGPVTVHGVSFGKREVTDNLALAFERGDAPGLHIGVLHCSLGEREGHGHYAPCSVGDLVAEMNAQPAKEQTVEDRAVDVTSARTDLRVATTAVDRLNKRYYDKLSAEARTNPALAEALANITTTSGNLPGTLGIRTLLQGGVNGLQLLVSYENGTYTSGATSTVEWMVEGVDTDFTHTAPADPSGNALGPFTIGQVVKLRTRVTNANGTTTGSVRTLTILNPAP